MLRFQDVKTDLNSKFQIAQHQIPVDVKMLGSQDIKTTSSLFELRSVKHMATRKIKFA